MAREILTVDYIECSFAGECLSVLLSATEWSSLLHWRVL